MISNRNVDELFNSSEGQAFKTTIFFFTYSADVQLLRQESWQNIYKQTNRLTGRLPTYIQTKLTTRLANITIDDRKRED